MLIPIGEMHGYQVLYEFAKNGGNVSKKDVCGVVFVPLIGGGGWQR